MHKLAVFSPLVRILRRNHDADRRKNAEIFTRPRNKPPGHGFGRVFMNHENINVCRYL